MGSNVTRRDDRRLCCPLLAACCQSPSPSPEHRAHFSHHGSADASITLRDIPTKPWTFLLDSSIQGVSVSASTSHFLLCQDHSIHAPPPWWGHAFFISSYMYFNERGWWGVLHPRQPFLPRKPASQPVRGLPASVRCGILQYQSQPTLCIFPCDN